MQINCNMFQGGNCMDKNIEETLSLSPLYVTMTEEEKKILIQKIVLTLNTPPDNEKTASGCISL